MAKRKDSEEGLRARRAHDVLWYLRGFFAAALFGAAAGAGLVLAGGGFAAMMVFYVMVCIARNSHALDTSQSHFHLGG